MTPHAARLFFSEAVLWRQTYSVGYFLKEPRTEPRHSKPLPETESTNQRREISREQPSSPKQGDAIRELPPENPFLPNPEQLDSRPLCKEQVTSIARSRCAKVQWLPAMRRRHSASVAPIAWLPTPLTLLLAPTSETKMVRTQHPVLQSAIPLRATRMENRRPYPK